MALSIPLLKKKSTIPQEKLFETEPITALDLIAPASITVHTDHVAIDDRIAKSFFVFSYPRYLGAVWLSSAINLDVPMDVSMFVHPIDTGLILKQLRRKVTEVQSELMEREEKGLVRDPELETAFQDLEALRDRLQTAQERMFRFGLYVTVYARTMRELRDIETKLRSIFESRLVYIKPAVYQQRAGFLSCIPMGKDMLAIHTPLNTEPLSSVFPFVSFDLSANEGVMYGINQHNNSLILFDRFSLENSNEVVFAKSGAGKSFMIKLEILRYLMMGVDVIVVDPENEYRPLAQAVGGSFFDISLGSTHHLNPFDLPRPRPEEEPADALRSNIINLVGLMRIMLGGLTGAEDSIVDKALSETYAAKDITPQSDPATWANKIPLLEDFEAVLQGMEGAESLVQRLQKYTRGSYAEFSNRHSNVSLENNLLVFGIREMEEPLRPMAMYIIMRYIWNKVRSELKKRIFVLDEAWWIMQSDDGASFLFGLAKRARKYYLGVTTITQDVEDFLKSEYGRPIIKNSSIQVLMKQSPAAIDILKKTFALTEQEKAILLECDVGEGIFFAGQKHVLMKVVASPTEHEIVTTSPKEILLKRQQQQQPFDQEDASSPE